MGIHISLFLVVLLSCTFSGRLSAAETIRKELRTKVVEGIQISKRSGRTNVIDPSWVTQVSWRPRVFLYRGFLSDEECDHLISWLHREDSSVASGDDFVEIDQEDDVVQRIEQRLSAWTFIPKENGRPLQVFRLEHEESKHNRENFLKESTKFPSEPLMATVVIYLSNVSEGGQILFSNSENQILYDCKRSNMDLKPTKGNAVLIFNAHLNASPDNSTSHTRCPLLGGNMWFASKIFHLKAIRGATDPSSMDGTGCTDEDESCPRWAASGECQRNPVFMVGSPDYYGTCRKSCDVCDSVE